MTPVSSEPICEASRMRWLSPPESDGPGRSSVRYPRPTSSRNLSRLRISFRSSSAIFDSFPRRPSDASQACASWIVSRERLTIPRSWMRTERLSGLSRSPPQVWHALSEK